MKKPTRRDEVSKLLALRDREGLTYAELSELCGLAATTLSWWSWRLKRKTRAGFAELVVQDERPMAPATSGIMLHLTPDTTIEVSNDFDAEALGRVIDVVRSRC